MSKRHSAKYKLDRRMGENIWGRPKSPINQRAYGPGQHGQRRKNKVSDFGLQLRAKQKLKGYYGNLTEKQFSRTYEEAARRKGNSSENLIALLESRLDAIVYRAKFTPTVFSARQFVNHGHVMVNGSRVNIASYRVKPGDVVQVRERSRNMALVLEALQLTERDVPDYIEVDPKAMSAKYIRTPELAEVPYPVKMEPTSSWNSTPPKSGGADEHEKGQGGDALAFFSDRCAGDSGLQQALFAQQGLQLARAVHLADDVAAADEFALHIELGDRWPIREALDALAQGVALQDVHAGEIHPQMVEDLHHRGREAAARLVRHALHEQHHGMLGHRLGDELMGLLFEGVGHGRPVSSVDWRWTPELGSPRPGVKIRRSPPWSPGPGRAVRRPSCP